MIMLHRLVIKMRIKYSCLQHIPLLLTHICQIFNRNVINLNMSVVLYAPTWRGTYSNNVYDVSKLQKDLEKLSKLNVQLIFRGHHLSEKHIKGKLNNIKVVPQSIDSNKLLGVTDLLITDYS